MTFSVADLIKVHVVIRTRSFEGHGSTKPRRSQKKNKTQDHVNSNKLEKLPCFSIEKDSKQNDKQSVANTEKQITIPLKK